MNMYHITHADKLKCVEGIVLRQREWNILGKAGCFQNTCPNPDECTLKLRNSKSDIKDGT